MLPDCIPWDGPTITTHGITYGRLPGKKMVLAHRAAYEEVHGPIPEGLVIDHTCRFGLCVNVAHLEAVTNAENILRGEGICAQNARKTHCVREHELVAENLINRSDGRRDCRLCDRIRRADRKARMAA